VSVCAKKREKRRSAGSIVRIEEIGGMYRGDCPTSGRHVPARESKGGFTFHSAILKVMHSTGCKPQTACYLASFQGYCKLLVKLAFSIRVDICLQNTFCGKPLNSGPANSASRNKKHRSISHGIDILTDDYLVFSQCMRLPDRQTNGRAVGRTEFRSQERALNTAVAR